MTGVSLDTPDTPDAEDAASESAPAEAQRELLDRIDDLLPVAGGADGPVLVVVTGSTGVGKSTLVNAVAGAPVSPTGVIRPTTRTPVLVCHPDDEPALDGAGAGSRVPAGGMPPGLALLDSPDPVTAPGDGESVALQAADRLLFVTTATRYADAAPWSVVADAVQRGATLGIVLNRVPPGSGAELRTHLDAMLDEHGLGVLPVRVVEEVALDEHGRLPADAAAPVLDVLVELAGRADESARRTVAAALPAVREQVTLLADAADAEEPADDGPDDTSDDDKPSDGKPGDDLRAALESVSDAAGERVETT